MAASLGNLEKGMTTHNSLKKGTRVLLSHIPNCPWPRFGVVLDDRQGTERNVDIVAYDPTLPEGESYAGLEIFAVFDEGKGFWRPAKAMGREAAVLARGTRLLCKHPSRVFPLFMLSVEEFDTASGGPGIQMVPGCDRSPYVGGEGGPTHVGEIFACFNDFTKGKSEWEFLGIRKDHAAHWAQVVGAFNHTVNYFPQE